MISTLQAKSLFKGSEFIKSLLFVFENLNVTGQALQFKFIKMSAPMHFRKRQLLEYQIETNLNQLQQTQIPQSTIYNNIYEPEIKYEYPMSPASIGSERLSPTEPENETETEIEIDTPSSLDLNNYSTEQMQVLAKHTVALLEMENLTPKSNKDAQLLKQIAESLTALENFAKNSNLNLAGGIGKLSYDSSVLLHTAFNLKQTIEDYIKQEIQNSTSNKSTLSTMILAKLNQLRVNALLKSKACLEPPDVSKEMPQDLSMKNKLMPVTNDDVDYEESNLVIDESYVDDGEDESEKSKNGLHQLANRISGIFTFINRTQSRMEEFMRQGINVVSLTKSKKNSSASHSKKSKKSSENRQKSVLIKNSLKTLNLPSQTCQKVSIKKELPLKETQTNIPQWPIEDDVKYKSQFPLPSPFDKTRVIIGLNGTTISTAEWSQIDWDQTPPAITRKILMMLFDREYLATHSLTGRPSPAFLELNYPEKKPLNPYIVKDIVDLVTSRTMATPKEVRMAITTKCADESKMRRGREARQIKQNENLRIKPY